RLRREGGGPQLIPATRKRRARRVAGFELGLLRQHQRISSTGATPMISRPDAITVAVASTRASRAAVSRASADTRNRRLASSFPLFQRPWKAAATSDR